MSLLSPSSRPTKFLSSSAPKTTTTQSTIQALITPAINHSLYLATALRAFLSTSTIFILWRCSLVLQFTQHFGLLLYANSRHVSLLLARHLVLACRVFWKRTEKTRDRLFFEFMVFVLGGGNGVFLFVFWPGWILVGLGLFMAWALGG